MHTKWPEDLLALANTRSFTRAADLRHVTHAAFGRRIRALAQWAGVALAPVRTSSMAGTLQRIEPGDVDFLLACHHPPIATRLRPAQYLQHTVAHQRLVPSTPAPPNVDMAPVLEDEAAKYEKIVKFANIKE